MRRILGVLALFCVVMSSGCLLGGDDDECLAVPTGQDQAVPQPPSVRNPVTGLCEDVPFNPPFCDPNCGPCPDVTFEEPPTWGLCFSQCTGLDEATCRGTAGCRTAFLEVCDGSDCSLVYEDCWATDQTGPLQGGDCEQLGAEDCSRYDDCAAVHSSVCGDPTVPSTCQLGTFSRCQQEPAPPPATGSCWVAADCTTAPPSCPTDTLAGVADGCYTGFCIPIAECETAPACADMTAEHLCIARPDCTPAYVGENCTCTAQGCSCATLTFSNCDDA